MAARSTKPLRIASLQEYELVPVTDPAEWAALERKVREAQKSAAAKVEALYRELPAAAQRELLARLVAELTADQQRRLVDQLGGSVQPGEGPRGQQKRRRRNGKP
jgi:hypothetical protein